MRCVVAPDIGVPAKQAPTSYDHHRTIKYFLDFVTRVQTFCTFDALMDYEMDIESYVTHVCNQLKKNDS
ncbi:hypothetical protein M513_11058 [Trichuris suis]|uniref:Uncharacterized protein n=1 Tax=Trichuris suis TaxID=68888 RepID=A0A085LSU2_9BILA|nr:hypothetical protein M513_11058 [Trichuris suis]